MKVRLTRKLAQMINGVDLSRARTGEELDLSSRDARVLISEGWALPIDRAHDTPRPPRRPPRKRNQ